MKPIGLGVDVVDLQEIDDNLKAYGEHALRQFTAAEREYAGSGPNQIARLAARHAAKEAVMKALGLGWDDGIAWTDIEVYSEATGAPGIRLHGGASNVASRLGISAWLISLSHSDTVAVATVIAMGGE